MPEEQKSLTDYEAFVQNNQLMQHVVREMKEIPTLPSEVPTDVNPLLKVEFPEEGGVLTYMGNYEYPYKGFPFFEFVDKIDIIKKILRGTMSSFFHSLKERNKLELVFLLTVPWLFGVFIKAQVYTFHRMVERFKVKPIRYCTAIRELHRAMSIEREELTSERTMRFMIRDLACMFLEFDNAYRFRFQDVIVELDTTKLAAAPIKEIVRLADVMIERERTQEVKDTWALLKFFLPWYLRFNPNLRRALVEVLMGLDLTKTVLSIEDQLYCSKRKDYTFAFMKQDYVSS